MSNLLTKIFYYGQEFSLRARTMMNSTEVGKDAFGNRYFTDKKPVKGRRPRRWVLFNGIVEPSKVPPEWHGWLHHTTDTVPTGDNVIHHAWQKQPVPNLTGTEGAYLPKGHLLREGHHAHTIAKVEPWQP